MEDLLSLLQRNPIVTALLTFSALITTLTTLWRPTRNIIRTSYRSIGSTGRKIVKRIRTELAEWKRLYGYRHRKFAWTDLPQESKDKVRLQDLCNEARRRVRFHDLPESVKADFLNRDFFFGAYRQTD